MGTFVPSGSKKFVLEIPTTLTDSETGEIFDNETEFMRCLAEMSGEDLSDKTPEQQSALAQKTGAQVLITAVRDRMQQRQNKRVSAIISALSSAAKVSIVE